MIFLWISFFIYGVTSDYATPAFHLPDEESYEEEKLPVLHSFKDLNNVGFFNDAEHRGKKWYDDGGSSSSRSRAGAGDISASSDVTSSESSESDTRSGSSDASSYDTAEKKKLSRKYRTCTPCPHDKLKKYKNRGIKWICGAYQRARRTFKSDCMMRYRNCQDGTMFVKIYDHRCKNDTFHGRHWFYIYKT